MAESEGTLQKKQKNLHGLLLWWIGQVAGHLSCWAKGIMITILLQPLLFAYFLLGLHDYSQNDYHWN